MNQTPIHLFLILSTFMLSVTARFSNNSFLFALLDWTFKTCSRAYRIISNCFVCFRLPRTKQLIFQRVEKDTFISMTTQVWPVTRRCTFTLGNGFYGYQRMCRFNGLIRIGLRCFCKLITLGEQGVVLAVEANKWPSAAKSYLSETGYQPKYNMM